MERWLERWLEEFDWEISDSEIQRDDPGNRFRFKNWPYLVEQRAYPHDALKLQPVMVLVAKCFLQVHLCVLVG